MLALHRIDSVITQTMALLCALFTGCKAEERSTSLSPPGSAAVCPSPTAGRNSPGPPSHEDSSQRQTLPGPGPAAGRTWRKMHGAAASMAGQKRHRAASQPGPAKHFCDDKMPVLCKVLLSLCESQTSWHAGCRQKWPRAEICCSSHPWPKPPQNRSSSPRRWQYPPFQHQRWLHHQCGGFNAPGLIPEGRVSHTTEQARDVAQ